MIDWSRFSQLPLLVEEPMSRHTAARIGGPAERLLIARNTDDVLAEAIELAWAHDVPMRIFGGGANVLVSDEGLRGLVVLNRINTIVVDEHTRAHGTIEVLVSGGTSLAVLANKLAGQGIDFAWAAAIPGTVGGAIVNNAGAHGRDMAADLVSVLLATPEGQVLMPAAALRYAYRTSDLKMRLDRRFVVLRAVLRLPVSTAEDVEASISALNQRRRSTQPPGASLGSIFKNPTGDYAGRLIEACGLKGFSIGGASVSPVHANFFINAGGASARDYAALIAHVLTAVFEQTGVVLEPEIELVGAFS